MRFVKHWRFLLFALLVLGIGGRAVAYVRSPGYRAAQAFARIQEGMNPDQAHDIMRRLGGEICAISHTGIRFVEWDDRSYWFGGRCYVHLKFPPISENGPHCLVEKWIT